MSEQAETNPPTVTLAEAADAIKRIAEPSALDATLEFFSRFIYAPDEELWTLSAWSAHTYVFRAFPVTGRLQVTALGKDSGKTRTLIIASRLSHNGVMTMNASVPSVYKIIEQENPTLFFDEADNMFTGSGVYSRRKDLLAILNAGWEDEGFVWRQVENSVHKYPVFVPCAFAGIGRLPDTLESRCFTIRLEPKPPTAKLERWRQDFYGGEAKKVAAYLQAWMRMRGSELNPRPEVPAELGQNRSLDIWETLISIGDLDGPVWGKRMRQAALKLACGIESTPRLSPAEDLIVVIAGNSKPEEFYPTNDLITLLGMIQHETGDLAWAKWLGDPIIASRQIAALLRPHGIESEQKWLDGENRRGYHMGGFHMWSDRIRSRNG